MPSNVQAFYAEGQWVTRFGVTGPYYGPAGHRGLDVAASSGQAIPALRSGIVRRIQYSSIVGHTVAVESAPGVQSLASRGGYTGPIDGIPGIHTYAGLANLLD